MENNTPSSEQQQSNSVQNDAEKTEDTVTPDVQVSPKTNENKTVTGGE